MPCKAISANFFCTQPNSCKNNDPRNDAKKIDLLLSGDFQFEEEYMEYLTDVEKTWVN
jgi:hypothetical protein